MDTVNLVDSFREFKELKNIDRETMMGILEEVFRNMIIKKYGADDNFDIIINPEKGDLEIWHNREIVENGEVEANTVVQEIETGYVFHEKVLRTAKVAVSKLPEEPVAEVNS